MKNLYINLIKLILHNIKDLERIRRVYTYAQSLWFDEKAQDPGG